MDQCKVPVSHRIGEEGKGLTIFNQSMRWESRSVPQKDLKFGALRSGLGLSREGILFLSSSKDNETSWDDPQRKHGLLTAHLLAGLRGETNPELSGKGQITSN